MKYVPQEFYNKTQKGIINIGDILICKDGALSGKIAFVKKNFPYKNAMINEHLFLIRTNNAITQKLVFYFLYSDVGQMLLKSKITGQAQGGINRKNLLDIKIPLPPIEIQEKIVTEIEEIEKKEKENEEKIEKTKTNEKSIIDKQFLLNKSLTKIGSIINKVQYGISKKMNKENRGYKIFRMDEIINRKMFDNRNMKYVDITPEEFSKYKLNKNDLLFNRTNSIEHVGKTGIFVLDGVYCFASYLIRVIVNNNLAVPYFVCLMMNSETFQKTAKSVATKSINQANINAEKLKNLEIPLPSVDEQKRIVKEIEFLEIEINTLKQENEKFKIEKEKILKKYL